MAVQRTITFGENAAARKTGRVQDDRPKAEFWMNIGYSVEVETENGLETRFVSLPAGIPLDTMEALPTNSRNVEFASFQSSRNDLLGQIMEVCKTLEAGEEKIIGEAGGLQIQVRRINKEAAAIKPKDNPFSRRLSLVG